MHYAAAAGADYGGAARRWAGYTLTHAGRQVRLGPIAFWVVVGTLVIMAVWTITTATYFAFRDEPGEHVLAEGEIGGGADGPQRHDDQRADNDPEGDRPEAHLTAGMDETQARPPRIMRPAGIIAMMVL